MEHKDLIFQTTDDILDFAYQKEKEASEFYLKWKNQVRNEAVKQVLYEFMKEEIKHMELIQDVKSGKKLTISPKSVMDLKLGDYFAPISPDFKMDFQDAVRIAIQRELGSVKLYGKLASEATVSEIKQLFLMLKEEEQKHKLRLETLYDDEFLKDN